MNPIGSFEFFFFAGADDHNDVEVNDVICPYDDWNVDSNASIDDVISSRS